MGFVGNLFNGSKGNGFEAQNAPIINSATAADAQAANAGASNALAQQQAFVNALMQQNGVGNQQAVFNAMQGTGNQLQGIADGTGPNPAQAVLNNATGANVANQAALMAGQRGSGANAGLIARQAGMQGAATQQQAVGQGAAMQAQQSLGALGQLQGQQQAQAALANTQVGQQAQGTQALNNAAQGYQGNVLNAIQGVNNANVANTGNMNNANAGIAGINAKAQNDITSGFINAAGGATKLLLADGGEVPATASPPSAMPRSKFGQALGGAMQTLAAPMAQAPGMPTAQFQTGQMMGNGVVNGIKGLVNMFTPAPAAAPMASGMTGLDSMAMDTGPAAEAGFARGGNVGSKMKAGGKVPGKAAVKGDSMKNDTVEAKLSPGEVVIPRSVMQSDDPAGNAAKFVQAVLARQNPKGMKRQ